MVNLLAEVTSLSSDTATGSYSQIDAMTSGSVTIVGTGSIVLLILNIEINDVGDTVARVRFTVDASATGSPECFIWADQTKDRTGAACLCWAVTGLSAGSHTFTAEWIAHNATSPATATDRTRSFQVIELDTDATLQVDIGSSSADSAPASFANVDAMAGTFTPTTGAMQILLANLPGDHTQGGDKDADVRFAIGGARDGPYTNLVVDAADELGTAHMMWAETGQSATSKEFSLQWQRRQSINQTNETYNRTLQVVEVDANFSLAIDVQLTSAGIAPDTYADMTGMTGTMTPTDTDSVVMVISCGVTDDQVTADQEKSARHRLADGGTQEGPEISTWTDGTDEVYSWCFGWAKTSISGSHTFSHQWLDAGQIDLDDVNLDTTRERTFQVIDFKAAAAGGSEVLPRRNAHGFLSRAIRM